MEFEYSIDEFKDLCKFIKDVKKIDRIDLSEISNYYDEFIEWKTKN